MRMHFRGVITLTVALVQVVGEVEALRSALVVESVGVGLAVSVDVMLKVVVLVVEEE